MKNKRQLQAKNIRTHRKIHRTSGVFLFVFFFIIALTGILLAWKKHSSDMINPKTYHGISSNLNNWLSISDLKIISNKALTDSISSNISLELDRIDIRDHKGVAKFIYKKHYWEVQLDGSSGKLLHLGKRNGDLIENIHDGSVLDNYFGTEYGQIKLVYSSLSGLALILFTITGFWLWYGPKRMKKSVKKY